MISALVSQIFYKSDIHVSFKILISSEVYYHYVYLLVNAQF